MKKILVIIPYFGKLPNYFQAFLNSCRNTQILDFLLITDDHSNYSYPNNFTIEYWSFATLQKLIKKNLGDKAYITHPYKLCDYRPLYGCLFADYLKDYDFWAHSDIDLIFGDIDKFLQDLNYINYDRVFPYGHFSIYKNNSKMNQLFKEKLPSTFPEYFDINFVKQTTYPCHFDEIGVNIIIKNLKLSFFEGRRHINTNINFYNLCVEDGRHKTPCIIVYENGKIFTLERIDNKVVKKEFLYVHLQGKKFADNLLPQNTTYIICKDGFIDYYKKDEDLYFKKYGLNGDNEHQVKYLQELKKNIKKGKKQKFYRELREYPFRSVYNIYHRFMSILYLKSNNLF